MMVRMGDKVRDPAGSRALALVPAAVAILVGVWSKMWLVARGVRATELHYGPRGVEACNPSGCGALRGAFAPPLDVVILQWLALAGGFLALAVAVEFGGMALAKRRGKLPSIKAGTFVLAGALAAMLAFEIRVLADGELHLGWAAIAALAGTAAAIAALRWLGRALAEPEPIATRTTQPSGEHAPP